VKHEFGRRRAHKAAHTAAIAAALLLSACGQPAPQSAKAPSPDTAPAMSGSLVNAFEFAAPGIEAPLAPAAADLTLAGGCNQHGPLSIGFTRRIPDQDRYFNFAFDSAEPVAPGQTGAIALTSISWDNGMAAPPGLPADSPLRVPVRFSGEGTLTLHTHTGLGLDGRMTGVVEGAVTNDASQQSTPISVSFDINLACAE
jgi:hypothetical protein